MKGNFYPYRNGYRVVLYHEGKRVEVRSYQGIPLVHPRQCTRVLELMNADIDAHMFNPSDWGKEKPFLFKNACDLWIKLSDISRETLDSRERIAGNQLIPYFGEMDIRKIQRIHVDQFLKQLREKKYSDKTVYNIIGELRACLRFHRDSIPRLPSFPKIIVQDPPIVWLTEDQQDKVFEFIPEADRPIFIFQRYSGCRPNEARGLLRENVHRDKGIIIISSVIDSHGALIDRTKTKRVGVLPIIPEIEDALKPREVSRFVFTRKGQPYGKRTHEYLWKQAMDKAHEKYGVPIVSMYPGTKHSLGMNRLNQGINKDVLQALFGHTDKKSTERYAKYLAENLAPAMRGKVTPLGQILVNNG